MNYSMKLGWNKLNWALFFIAVILAIYLLRVYLVWTSVSTMLGLAACILVGSQDTEKGGSLFYGLMALGATILVFLIPVKTIFYFATAFAIIHAWTSIKGPRSLLLIVVLVFMSPFFQYLVQVFSFPIRLNLTNMAGTILGKLMDNIKVEGNVLVHQGTRFSIDEVCMGLNMVVVSLLLGMVLWTKPLPISKPVTRKFTLPFWLYLVCLLGLNGVMNLLRIVLIVFFHSMPGTWSHEIIGLLCLVVYVVLPLMWLIQFKKPVPEASKTTPYSNPLLSFIISLFLLIAGFLVFQRDTASNSVLQNLPAIQSNKWYQVEYINSLTKKLTDSSSLVYIKTSPSWYQADHNPQICWRGAGYTLTEIEYRMVNGKECFYGILEKDNVKLHTIWWYQNDKDRTLSQLEWRWNQFKGSSPYQLINITVSDPKDLEQAYQKLEHYKNI